MGKKPQSVPASARDAHKQKRMDSALCALRELVRAKKSARP